MSRAKELELRLKDGQELFEGDYRTIMFKLRRAGLTPWSTEDIMDARNDVDSGHPLWGSSFHTDFGVAEIEDKFYLRPHSENLRSVTPKTSLIAGYLPLDVDLDVDGSVKVYESDSLILNRELSDEEARASPLWLAFAGGDQKRLDKYVENTFRFGKDRFGYDRTMDILVSRWGSRPPLIKAVMLCGLSIRPKAICGSLDAKYAWLVGVRK